MAQNAVYGGAPRVNLMPPSEIERRERRSLLGRWVVILLGILVVTALVIAGALSLKLMAAQRLAEEEDRTNELLVEMAALSEVSEKITLDRELVSYRQEAMNADLNWGGLLASITAVLPAGVSVTAIDVNSGAGPSGSDGASGSDGDEADPTTARGASLSITFVSPGPVDIVTVTRTVREVPTVLIVEGMQLTRDTPVGQDPAAAEGAPVLHTYVLTIVTTEDVYSDRFAPEDATGESAEE